MCSYVIFDASLSSFNLPIVKVVVVSIGGVSGKRSACMCSLSGNIVLVLFTLTNKRNSLVEQVLQLPLGRRFRV